MSTNQFSAQPEAPKKDKGSTINISKKNKPSGFNEDYPLFQATNKQLLHFFSTSNKELRSTVDRLDELLGKHHWLSVGTYKETLLKKTLCRVVPCKYSIDSGFVFGVNRDGNIIRSAQSDILIWDYSGRP